MFGIAESKIIWSAGGAIDWRRGDARIVGASLVTVVTDLIGALQFHFLLRRKLHLPDMTWVSVRILMASVLMGVAVRLADDLNLFLFYGVKFGSGKNGLD